MGLFAAAIKPRPTSSAAFSESFQLKKKNVLIIEDEYSIRQMMRDVLELEGYSVSTASDGSEGFALLKSMATPPSAIILDLMMPGTSGWQFLDLLRGDPATATIPVIVCSAYNESAKSVHPDAIIQKPVKLDALLNTISFFCT